MRSTATVNVNIVATKVKKLTAEGFEVLMFTVYKSEKIDHGVKKKNLLKGITVTVNKLKNQKQTQNNRQSEA